MLVFCASELFLRKGTVSVFCWYAAGWFFDQFGYWWSAVSGLCGLGRAVL